MALGRPDLRVVRCGGARKTNALGTEGSAPTIAAHLACRTKGLCDDFFMLLLGNSNSKWFLKGVPDKGSSPFSGTNTTGKTTTPDSFYITQGIKSLPIATIYQKIIFRQVNLLKAGLKSTQASATRGPREYWKI